MPDFIPEPAKYEQALAKLDSRLPITARLKSAEWASVPVALRERAFFSATIENARFLQEARDFLRDYQKHATEMTDKGPVLKAQGRAQFVADMQALAERLGMGPLAPKKAGTIEDISSAPRLRLIFDTMTQAAADYAYFKDGQDPAVLNFFPAQKFIRVHAVEAPRDYHEKHRGEIRRKDDLEFWISMNRDFRVPWGPWGYGSGMGVEDVDRETAEALGLVKPGEVLDPVKADFNDELAASTTGLDADILAHLKGVFGDQAAFANGRVRWEGQRFAAPSKPAPLPLPEGYWPATIDQLQSVRSLGGSTGAELVRDPVSGREYVRKYGASPDHLREEALADQLYQSLGIDVPKAKVYDTARGPAKLAEFIPGAKTLDAYLKTASAADQARILAQIRKDFLADAILGNWDVAGMDLDNILVDGAGKAWRIDNGGSLRFRAQGGRKAAFGAEVEELESMRDKAKNPQTARIFADLSDDDLREQWKRLFGDEAQRARFLALAPAELRGILEGRIDDARARIFKESAALPRDPAGRKLTNLISEEFAKAVKESRASGRALAWDSEDIEDCQVLFWEETNRYGEKVLRASLRATEAGSARIMAKLQPMLSGDIAPLSYQEEAPQKKALSGPQPIPMEPFWDKLLAAAKTAGKHAADGQYNQDTLGQFDEMYSVLKQYEPITPENKAMKAHYLKEFAKIEDAVANGAAPAKVSQFLWEEPAAAKAAPEPKQDTEFSPTGDFSAKRQPWDFWVKERVKGFLKETKILNSLKGSPIEAEALRVRFEDGAFLKFVPYKCGDRDAMGMAGMWGEMEFSVKGGASLENVKKVAAMMDRIGVKSAPVSREYMQALAIRKTLRQANIKSAETDKIMAEEIPDAQKLAKMKDAAAKALKKALPEDILDYMPTGDLWGNGWASNSRVDISDADLKKALGDTRLYHQTDDIGSLLRSLLQGGGFFTSTKERLRIGVQITFGMSPDEDMHTNGASYLFTRLKDRLRYGAGAVVFKQRILARSDLVSFKEDRYGATLRLALQRDGRSDDYRQHTISKLEEMRKIAADPSHTRNETNIKRGVSIFGDDGIDFVVVHTFQEQQALIDYFKAEGYKIWPDGRPLESVIRLPGQTP